MFFAQTHDKHERVQHRAMGETREDAALAVFEMDPQAKVCSTLVAVKLRCGQYWNSGDGERWHRPSDFPTPDYD